MLSHLIDLALAIRLLEFVRQFWIHRQELAETARRLIGACRRVPAMLASAWRRIWKHAVGAATIILVLFEILIVGRLIVLLPSERAEAELDAATLMKSPLNEAE